MQILSIVCTWYGTCSMPLYKDYEDFATYLHTTYSRHHVKRPSKDDEADCWYQAPWHLYIVSLSLNTCFSFLSSFLKQTRTNTHTHNLVNTKGSGRLTRHIRKMGKHVVHSSVSLYFISITSKSRGTLCPSENVKNGNKEELEGEEEKWLGHCNGPSF